MRRKAAYLGAAITTVAFVSNELVRLRMRSPLFSLKI
jgi:hypothetical protein